MRCEQTDNPLPWEAIRALIPDGVWSHIQSVLVTDPSVVSRIVVDESGTTDGTAVELSIAEYPMFDESAVTEFNTLWKENDPTLDMSPNPETIVPNLIRLNNWIFALTHGLVTSTSGKEGLDLLKQWWVYWYVTYVTQNPGTPFNNVHLFIIKPEGVVTYQAFYLAPRGSAVVVQ